MFRSSVVLLVSIFVFGSNIKVASAILNCILARQLCFEDASCSAILEIIPRVCGPIPVSCSTVTVTKCQAALRTLQAFQFFRPTCLCKEPGMDPDCNHFRDFLFDHPCGFVLKKAEKDPYPIDALPTCNHALSVCQQERKCLKLFEDFKTHCKVRDNKCKMESRDACHDSWTNLRLSPMFGCICPNNHMKKRCDRIFNIVNHNPCVDRLIFFPNGLTTKFKQKPKQPKMHKKHRQKSTTTTSLHNNYNKMGTNHTDLSENGIEGVHHHRYTDGFDMEGNKAQSKDEENADDDDDEEEEEDEEDDDYDDRIRAEIYSNYPHYLHPPSWGLNNPLVLASHSPQTHDDDDDVVVEVSHKTKSRQKQQQRVDDVVVVVQHTAGGGSVVGSVPAHETVIVVSASPPLQKPFATPASTIKHRKTSISSTKLHKNMHHTEVDSNNNKGSDNLQRTYAGKTMDERVKVMGMDDKLHQKIFVDNLALIDTPLIATAHYTGNNIGSRLGGIGLGGTNFMHNQLHGVLMYPFNISEFQLRHASSTVSTSSVGGNSEFDVIDTAIAYGGSNGNGNGGGGVYYQSGQDVEVDLSTEIIKQHFQSTCHTALDTCREDSSCSSSLQPMLSHCEAHRCNRNACMTSLQAFYKAPHEDLNLDIAFCLCKKTTNRHDMCMIAQEKLHPVCAQRPPDNNNQQGINGVYYQPPPACHTIAEQCKDDRECRLKLEYYEQACAVDSVTKKCAGRPSGCRTAMIGILGTMLRTTCVCQGPDPQTMYQCVGWRRLLWLNPCVVEAQKDFHMKRLAEMGYLTTTTTTTTTTSTTSTTTTTTPRPTIRQTPPKPAVTKTTPTTTLSTHHLIPPAGPKQTAKKPPSHIFREFAPKGEKVEPNSMEHNYIEQPDSIPLHSGNEENGNTGNDDYNSENEDGTPTNASAKNGNANKNNNDNNHNGRSNNAGSGRNTKNNKNGKNSKNNSKYNGNTAIAGVGVGGGGNFDDQLIFVEHEETTEYYGQTARETTTTTTTSIPTTTQSPRNCVVQRPHQSDQLIREGSSRRIYSLDDVECSELCACGDSLTLTCHALCVPFAPCRTALAFYSHASPAYQAFRGRCLCYSGRFICMKPPMGEYTLPGGVFLLLGYSSADEALLRPHTNLGVQDGVRALQQYVNTYIDNQTQCTLTLFNMTDENIIISARLPHDPKLQPLELLRKEKDECTSILKTISHHINSEHNELQSHRLLSIFKMSEVEVVWPETSHASPSIRLYHQQHFARFQLITLNLHLYLLMPLLLLVLGSSVSRNAFTTLTT